MSATFEQAVARAAVRYGPHDPAVGAVGSAADHARDLWPAPDRRRKCGCGCGGRETHVGGANAVALTSGCELYVRRWVRHGSGAARG